MIDVIVIMAFVLMGCVILMLGIWHIDLVNENEAIQRENSNLIERNQKLDTYLDEARAEAVKANHKLMKLEYTEKVYQVIRKNNGVIYGNFRNKDNAEKFINGNINYFIKECQIAD